MKKGKFLKRLLLGLGIFLLLFIGTVIALPFLFKDDIIAAVKQAVNDNLNAKVDFKEVDISLLRSFPNVSLQLNDYAVTGIGEFEGVKLVGGESFGVTVDFWSAWNFGKVPLNIKSVTLQKPEVNVIVLSNGKANYDIAKPTTDTSAATPFKIKLQEYGIFNGNLTYDDRLGNTFVKAVNLTHTGEGDFTQDVYDLTTKTSIDELTAESGGVPFLKKARFLLDAGFNVDMPNSKYTLRENSLTINDLQLVADGWLAMPNETDIDMDLKFSAPQSDFKSLLSLIPNAYIEGYENVKANGSFKFNGFANGKFRAEPASYPAFRIDLDVQNASVKYPDLPLGIADINTKLAVISPGSDLDQMAVDVSKFKLKIGSNPIEGWFKLRTPMSDPDIDTQIKGVLNLEELSKAFPMEGVKSLTGIINADVAAKTKMSTIDQGNYGAVNMNGTLSVKNVNYAADGLPPVLVNSLQMDFTPQRVSVPGFSMKLGKSDINGSGSIDNILAYFSPDATMKGNFTIRSNYFNADEWMTEDAAAQPAAASASTTESSEVFNRFDFTLDAAIQQMDYDVYKLKDLVARGNFSPNRLSVSQLSGKIGDSDFNASGSIENVWNYLFNNETLGGNLTIRSNYMNLNQFMMDTPATTPTAPTATAAAEPILVPANIAMKVNADIDKVLYDNMELSKVKGVLSVANEEVKFTNLAANTLGGSMAINGGYNTKNHEKPKFDFGMKLQKIDFQKAFNTFNTFKVLAPIGQYIEGNFNTDLTLNSDLKKDLMPEIATISAAGLLQTLNANIKNFKPLEEIANKLNVAVFKQISIKDTKNWFTVKDGAVQLQDFDAKYEDIAMTIGGSHKLEGDMDYHIIAKIPRSKIGKNAIGAAANTGLDFLSREASKVGVNLNAGEFVNVQINLGGKLTDPKVSFKVLGTDGTSTTIQDQAKAAVEAEAKKQLDKAKAEAEARLEAEKKKAEEEAAKQLEKAKAEAEKKAKEAAEKAAKEAAKKAGEKVGDKVGEEAGKKIDEAKKQLEKLNPLKKKKDGGG